MVKAGLHKLIIRAELAELAGASAWAAEVSRCLALPASTSYAVQLCLEEAISNIVRHGFAGGADLTGQTIDIELRREAGTAVLLIRDAGIPFDPTTIQFRSQPQSLDDMAVGGQGIHLMRQFSQAMEYRRVEGRNCLSLILAL